MDMNAMKGTQSIAFSESPYLVSAGSVAGKKEGEGPLGKYFDIASEDDLFGEKTWELAEGTMQKLACKLALKNAGVQPEEVRYLFGGDLLRQGIATSMGAEELQIPVFGLFGACSTSGEALALAAMTVAMEIWCLLQHRVILEVQKKNSVFHLAMRIRDHFLLLGQ